ncbi:VanZ family protein [Telmatospirillum sp. J64-1]|uniref:VanZ family protein n=1 Tax=Telmatospirillum sp. J64-1 TaxID=2502183 RepID=UPI00163D5D25|nr:VanZ family protein [Telmatospirillum sp. J64-1]
MVKLRQLIAEFRFLILAASAVGFAIIAYLSLQPWAAPPGGGMDKLIHLGVYAAAVVLPVAAAPSRRSALLLAFCGFLLGLGLEWLQGFVPGRAASLGDAVANTIGVFIGSAIGFKLRR